MEKFTAAVDRTETTRIFLNSIRDSQLFEAWARERAALVGRAAAEVSFQLKNPDFLLKNPDLPSGILIFY